MSFGNFESSVRVKTVFQWFALRSDYFFHIILKGGYMMGSSKTPNRDYDILIIIII